MINKMKILILLFGLFSFVNCFSWSQTSVFIPKTSYLENSDIKFSVRVKNMHNSFLNLNFNTNCHFRFRIYKNKQLVYPRYWYETCKSFAHNRLFLNKNSSIENEFVIPGKSLNPGTYLVVNTVNNVDLRQVISFEVVKNPTLISGIGEICGGYQNIQCDLGLSCNQSNKGGGQFGICEYSNLRKVDDLDQAFISKQSIDKDYKNYLNSFTKLDNSNRFSFVTMSDFFDTMYYLNPSKLYRSKSNRFIKRGEALSYIVKIFYGNFKDSSLDGYRFADTIFSNYRKEIDFAYNEFLDQKNEVYFRPEENLTNAELADWIKSLNNS